NSKEPVIPLSIQIPEDVTKAARTELQRLARDVIPVLREAGYNPDSAGYSTIEGRWLFWLLAITNGIPVSEWPRAPLAKGEKPECIVVGYNVFHASAVALRLVKAEMRQPEAIPQTDDREALAIGLLFKDSTVGKQPNRSAIAMRLGVSRQTLHNWPKFDAAFKA